MSAIAYKNRKGLLMKSPYAVSSTHKRVKAGSRTYLKVVLAIQTQVLKSLWAF
jgi:hypothetical protein